MSDIYSTLSHPKRRIILLDLFYEGSGTITHFKKDRKMKTGTLYHHLNILLYHELIEQTSEKNYKLTSKGLSTLQPLFKENINEYNRINREIHNNISNQVEMKFNEGMNYHKDSFYAFIDEFLSLLFKKVNIIILVNIISIFILIYSLTSLKIVLLGTHFINTDSNILPSISAIMTLIITFSLLWTYPKTLNRQEPVNKEFIMLGLISLIPISVSTFIIATMYTYGFQSLITTELLTIMEFTLQMFWLFWIYIIFRRINGLDYVKSLLGSFIVNYIWLTVILFF